MSDIDPELAARIEQIMLDEDAGRLPRTYRHQVRVETTPVDPISSAAARARMIARMREMTQKIDALTVGWLPSPLPKYCNWQWSDATGQGYRIHIFGMLLYIEVRFDLSVIVCHTWPHEDSKLMNNENQVFGPHEPVERIIYIMRSMAQRMLVEINNRAQLNQTQLLGVKYISDSAAPARVPSKSRDWDVLLTDLHSGQDISDSDYAAAMKCLSRYYNKRKKQARARTGRRK